MRRVSLTNIPFFQIIAVKDAKRRLSLSSEDSELEEPEYRKEVKDDLIVLDDHSQLLDDYHLKMVSCAAERCWITVIVNCSFVRA